MDILKIGVTGSRQGLTEEQECSAWGLLTDLMFKSHTQGLMELHHGDCIGADEHLAQIGHNLGYITVAHPPIIETFRAFHPSRFQRTPKPYLVRNRVIVDDTGLLVGFPKDTKNPGSGGTWFTINYARSVNQSLIIVWPDGTVTDG